MNEFILGFVYLTGALVALVIFCLFCRVVADMLLGHEEDEPE